MLGLWGLRNQTDYVVVEYQTGFSINNNEIQIDFGCNNNFDLNQILQLF
jgi:hypothetical protein